MRDSDVDDGFEFPGEDTKGTDMGLDVDLDFLDDVESMSPMGEPVSATTVQARDESSTEDDEAEMRARWADIQASFIDEPARACEQADNLVDLALSRLTSRFTRERDDLVRTWDRGHEPTDTEELRVAMKGYRSLIDRVLTAEL